MKRFGYIISSCLISILIGTSTCASQVNFDGEIKTHLIWVIGPDGLNGADEAYEIFTNGLLLLNRDLNLNFLIDDFTILGEDLFPQYETLDQLQRLYAWERWVRENIGTNKDVLYYVMLPPIHYGGLLYIGGYAINTCAYKRQLPVAIGNAELVNQAGLPRKEASEVIVAHELAHLIGAYHLDSSHNIMHSGALSFVVANEKLFFDPISAGQINLCLSNIIAPPVPQPKCNKFKNIKRKLQCKLEKCETLHSSKKGIRKCKARVRRNSKFAPEAVTLEDHDHDHQFIIN